MPRNQADISVTEADGARQRALEIEEEKKLTQKNRLKEQKKRKKRLPKGAPAPLKERLVAPSLLLLFLLLTWIAYVIGTFRS